MRRSATASSMAFSGTFVAAGNGTGVAVATGTATRARPHQHAGRHGRDADHAALRQMDQLRAQLTVVILAVSRRRVRLRRAGARLSLARRLHGGDRPRRRRDPRRPAGGDDHHAGDRRAAHGGAQRHRPAPAGGRDAGLGLRDLLRQDRHAHPQRDDGAHGRHGRTGRFEVSGVGYRPRGGFETEGAVRRSRATHPALLEAGRPRSSATTPSCARPSGDWIVDGDPMEGALLVSASRPATTPAPLRKQLPRTDEIPFDAQHRFMATLHHSHDEGAFAYVKGAPERMLAMCSRQRGERRRASRSTGRSGASRTDDGGEPRPARAGGGRQGDAEGKRDLTFADVERRRRPCSACSA